MIGKLRVVTDPADEQRLLVALSTPERASVLGFVNAHALNLVATSAEFSNTLLAADLLLRDGSAWRSCCDAWVWHPG